MIQTGQEEWRGLFTGHDLQALEAAEMDRSEEDRITAAEKNERINQQLKVYTCPIKDSTVTKFLLQKKISLLQENKRTNK